jgi:hypothetical protein
VKAGEFARRNPDGTITIAKFDPLKMFEGKLLTFGGELLPGVPEAALGLSLLDLRDFGNSNDSMQRVIGSPSGIEHFFGTPPPSPTPQRATPRQATPFPAVPTPPATPPPSTPPIDGGEGGPTPSPFSPGPFNGL